MENLKGTRSRILAQRLAVLTIAFALLSTHWAIAQTFTVLHSFTAGPFATNYDGAYPAGRLVADASGSTLYGTANRGGSRGFGTVFALDADGTGLTNLHNFNYFTDGSQPLAGLVWSGGRLYGTAWQGGPTGSGSVFALNSDGTGFTNLYQFSARSGLLSTNSDGANSRAGLALSSNGSTLYGTTEVGGSAGNGTVFKVGTNGTGFAALHHFSALVSGTNSDGYRPKAGLILSGNTLYGTALGGGNFGRGTVFKVNTDGTGFTTLHSFKPGIFDPINDPSSTNSDGVSPAGGLLLSGSTLYGTTSSGGIGGSSGLGTVFALNTNGTGFTTLHKFTSSTEGIYPETDLILSGETLYGTTAGGSGTLFALRTNGTGFKNLHNLDYASEGSSPGVLILLGHTLYGVASSGGTEGGSTGSGTLFSLSFTPQLAIRRSEANLIVTWPTNVAGFDYSGFTLQSTTNVVSPMVWSTNHPATTVVNGQNTVTNPASEPLQLFRLKAP